LKLHTKSRLDGAGITDTLSKRYLGPEAGSLRRGAFEVSVNGKLIFSKLEEGRFPEPKELKESIEAA